VTRQQPRGAPVAYVLVACAAFLWAASATLAKAAFQGGWIHGLKPVDVITLTQMRSTVSFLILFPLLLWRTPGRLRLTPKLMLACVLVGTIGVAGSNFFYYFAISRTSVATAIVVQYLAPVYVLLVRLFLRQERANAWRTTAVAFAVLGCALVVGIGSGVSLHANFIGIAAAQGAAITFAIYNLAGGALAPRVGSLVLMVYAMLGAALVWIIVQPPWAMAARHYDARQWIFLCVFAVVSMLIPYSLYFIALRMLDATRTIITSCLEPVFAVLVAWVALGESLRWLQVCGVFLIIAATILTQLPLQRPVRIEVAPG
jgi:drug/metabolite transporter (DMT)-like permease